MSEIERAIKVLKEEYAFTLECDATQKRSSAYKTALAVLRAELTRQEKPPLTCDGCMHLPQKYNGSLACENCSRGTILLDRYEPKGGTRMYAGLTISDKPALLDVKARGAEWVIAQWGGKAFGYKEKPKREEITDECCYGSYFEWSAQDGDYEIELGSMPYPLVSYQNTEPVNIDLALAQIAEMESAEKPLTWNERINQMTVEEKVLLFDSIISCMDCPAKTEWCNGNGRCNEALTLLLHRLYTEGETK